MFCLSLDAVADEHRETYRLGNPFPHAVLDGVFDNAWLESLQADFPPDDDALWLKYDSPGELKWGFREPKHLRGNLGATLAALNSPAFVRFVETLTGVPKLIADTEFHGGGLHRIPPGGKLFMHADFPRRPSSAKQNSDFPAADTQTYWRRINVLLYLTPGWVESWGGHLELRNGCRDENDLPVLEATGVRILPTFGRMIIFEVGKNTYHGHPDPLTCPPDRARMSLATYYFTREEPPPHLAEHTTRRALFWPRPGTSEDTPDVRAWCVERARPLTHTARPPG